MTDDETPPEEAPSAEVSPAEEPPAETPPAEAPPPGRPSIRPSESTIPINVAQGGTLFGEASLAMSSPRPSRVPKITNKSTEDTRVMRRIIAEDPNYNLATVAPLTDLCLKHCTDNFEFNSDVITHLDDRQRRKLLDSLPPDLPLRVTAHMIDEDTYWTRCCQSRWPVVDLSRHGRSWKRAFFERMLEETIENFVPGHTYAPRLTECVSYAAPFVRRLDIDQLLPPLRAPPKEKYSQDEGSEDDSDSENSSEPQLVDHLDLGPALQKLVHLEQLSVSYKVNDCGMNFDWAILQFTGHDCLNLSKAVQLHSKLRVLRLTQSRVDSERCRVLVNHILQHASLECLDLSHNFIGDRGARALSKLITQNTRLKTLDLTGNRLQATGGLALAHALARTTCHLVRLNLRLNRLKDDGGIAIAKSMLRNTSLRELNLAANDLNETAANYFAHVLGHNTTMTHLDLSNNQIGATASRKLYDGTLRNESLLYFDLRFTGSSQEAEYGICEKVEKNQDRVRLMLASTATDGMNTLDGAHDEVNLPTGITSVASLPMLKTQHLPDPIASV